MIGGMANLYPTDCARLWAGAPDAALEAEAARRIEAVDGNGGLAVLKAMLAERYADAGFAATVPPIAPLAPDVGARLAGELLAPAA